jgi:hypothetical protein
MWYTTRVPNKENKMRCDTCGLNTKVPAWEGDKCVCTPTVQKVLEIDGLYFDERELLLAAWADGLSEYDCRALVAELDDERNEEFAIQQEAEIYAEDAWLRAAESAGYDEAEAEYYSGRYW